MFSSYSIAQFSDAFPPIMDGVSIVTWNYTRWLNKVLGLCYAIFSYHPGYKDKTEFPVMCYFSIPFPFRAPYRIGLPRLDNTLYKKLNQLELRLVHAHCPFTSGRIALFYARKHGIPIVGTFHSKYREIINMLIPSKILTQVVLKRITHFYNSVDYVWVPNKLTGDTLKSYGYKGEVEIVQNGIDLVPPEDARTAYEMGNKLLGTSELDTVLLYVGQLVWEKNLKFLLDALHLVKRMGRRFKMVFLGEGYAKAALQRLTRNLNLGNEVQFKGVITDRKKLQYCYARANLFLFPSEYDTYSLVVREAATFKVPSVLLDHTNTSEGITHGHNGFLTKNVIGEYAQMIAFLIDHPEAVKEVGNSAFQTLHTPWEQVMDRVREKYIEIIEHYRK